MGDPSIPSQATAEANSVAEGISTAAAPSSIHYGSAVAAPSVEAAGSVSPIAAPPDKAVAAPSASSKLLLLCLPLPANTAPFVKAVLSDISTPYFVILIHLPLDALFLHPPVLHVTVEFR